MSARLLTFPSGQSHRQPIEPEEDAASLYFVTRDGQYLGRQSLTSPLTFGPPAFAYAFDAEQAAQLCARYPFSQTERV